MRSVLQAFVLREKGECRSTQGPATSSATGERMIATAKKEKGGTGRQTDLGLRVVTTEVTTLHHEQFVDGIVNRRVQTLRQGRRLVGRWPVMRVGAAALVASILTAAAFVLAYVEASFRAIQRQVATAETLARVSRIRV